MTPEELNDWLIGINTPYEPEYHSEEEYIQAQ